MSFKMTIYLRRLLMIILNLSTFYYYYFYGRDLQLWPTLPHVGFGMLDLYSGWTMRIGYDGGISSPRTVVNNIILIHNIYTL